MTQPHIITQIRERILVGKTRKEICTELHVSTHAYQAAWEEIMLYCKQYSILWQKLRLIIESEDLKSLMNSAHSTTAKRAKKIFNLANPH